MAARRTKQDDDEEGRMTLRSKGMTCRTASPLLALALAWMPGTTAVAWERIAWLGGSDVTVTGLERLSDGTYFATGWFRAAEYTDVGYTARVASDGHLIASERLVTSGRWVGACTATGGDLIQAGVTETGSCVRRRSPDLSEKWCKWLPLPEYAAREIIPDAANGCIIEFGHVDPIDGRIQYRIVRFDDLGAVSWAVDVGDYPCPLLPLRDGGALVSGRSSTFRSPTLMRLDAAGGVRWQASAPNRWDGYYGPMVEDADGTIVAIDNNPTSGSSLWTRWSADGLLLTATSWDGMLVADIMVRDGGLVANGPTGPFLAAVAANLQSAQVTTFLGGPSNEGGPFCRSDAALTLRAGNTQRTTAAPRYAWILSLGSDGSGGSPCLDRYSRTATGSPRALSMGSETWPVLAATVPALTDGAPQEVPFTLLLTPALDDAFEDDDDLPSAIAIVGGETQHHAFCDDAEDWLAFEADRGVAYEVRTSTSGPLADTRVEVHGPDGTLEASADDDGAGGAAARLTFVPTTPGRWYVRVSQQDGVAGTDRDHQVSLDGYTTPQLRWSRTLSVGDVRSVADTAFGPVEAYAGGWCLTDPSGLPMAAERTLGFVAAARDGGMFGSGQVGADQWLARFDARGRVAWSRTLAGVGITPYTEFAERPDGSVVVAGSGASAAFVAALDTAGEPVWTRTLGVYPATYKTALVATPDGGAYFATATRLVPSNEVLVVKFDALGAIEWARILAGPDSETWVAAMAPTADGGCMLAATPADARAAGASNLGMQSWVARLSPVGDLMWDIKMSSRQYLHVVGGTASPDGGLLLAGEGDLEPPRAGGAFLMHVTEGGIIAWSRGYDSGFYDGRFWCASVARDGSLLVGGRCGKPTPGDYPWDGWMLHLDGQGRVAGGCDDDGHDVIITSAPAGLTSVPTALDFASPSITSSPADLPRTPESRAITSVARCLTGAVPGEVSPRAAVTLLRFEDRTTLSWEPAAFSGADSFDVFRGSVQGLWTGDHGECMASGLVSTRWSDAQEPTNGCWFYLVAGRNRFGTGVLTVSSNSTRNLATHPCR